MHSSAKIMPDAVESVQEIARGLDTGRSERRFELVFGGSSRLDHAGRRIVKTAPSSAPLCCAMTWSSRLPRAVIVGVLPTAAGDVTGELRASRFEIVVLDVGLPDADDIDVLDEIRRRQDATPVLIF